MAKEHPRYAETEWEAWEFREYPMMVYPGAKDQARPYDERGRPLPGVLVQNADEARQAMGLEVSTVATSSKGVARIETDDDSRERVIAEAKALGIKFDKTWSVARIQDAIDSAKSPEPV